MDDSDDSQPSRAADSFPSTRALGQKEIECAKSGHGVYTSRGVMFGRREVWTVCPACEDERKDAERQELQERAESAKAAARVKLIGEAEIPIRFQTRGFDNFQADTQAKRHALTVCREYAEDFPANLANGSGLILAGLPGTGKSHLASGVIHSVLGRFSARYSTCIGMIRAVRDTWRRDSERSEAQVIRHFSEELDLLVIDEVGATYGTEGEQTLLFEVIDRRYSAMRPTILLTNQDKAGFREYVGDRVFDRLRETSRWVAFDWPSYRGQQREKA